MNLYAALHGYVAAVYPIESRQLRDRQQTKGQLSNSAFFLLRETLWQTCILRIWRLNYDQRHDRKGPIQTARYVQHPVQKGLLLDLENHFNRHSHENDRAFSEITTEVRKTVKYLRRFESVIDGYRNFTIGHWDAKAWRIPTPEFMPPPVPAWLDHRDCHEINVSNTSGIRTNCIVPFSVE